MDPLTSTTTKRYTGMDMDARANGRLWRIKQPVQQPRKIESEGIFDDVNFSLFWLMVFFAIRVYSICGLISLMIQDYNAGQYNYMLLTIICFLLGILITTTIYARICWKDKKRSTAFRIVMNSIVRNISLICYKLRLFWAKKREEKENADKLVDKIKLEERDVSFLLLFQCFFETTPTKILTISILLRMEEQVTWEQLVFILAFFGMTAWTLCEYVRCFREVHTSKRQLSWKETLPMLIGYFFITTSRTICIASVAALFPVWTLMCCLCHAFIYGPLTFLMDKPEFFENSPIINNLFSLAVGVVYLHVYIPVKEESTFYKYTIYYAICFIENILCIAIFFNFSTDMKLPEWIIIGLSVSGIAFYVVGVLCMIFYYRVCRAAPTRNRPYPDNEEETHNLSSD